MKSKPYLRKNYYKNCDGSNTILSNINRTRTSFFKHPTNSKVFIELQHLNFCFKLTKIEYWTQKPLLIYSSNWLEHWTDSNMFIFYQSNSNTPFLASNNRTLNFDYSSTHRYTRTPNKFAWIVICASKLILILNLAKQFSGMFFQSLHFKYRAILNLLTKHNIWKGEKHARNPICFK